MSRASRQKQQDRRKTARLSRPLQWIVTAGVASLAIYGVTQLSSIAYTDRDIAVVDFSMLGSKERNHALETANRARCTCSCGMTLAQCVATDSTCPVRNDNIDRIKRIVDEARPRG